MSDQAPPARRGDDWLTRASDVSGKLLVLGAGVVVLFLAFWMLRAVMIPIFLAVLVSTQLLPAVEWLKAHRFPSWLAVTLTMLGAILIFWAVVVGIVGQFIGEMDELGRQISNGADDAAAWVADNSGPLDWSKQDVEDEVSNLGDKLDESADTIFAGFIGGVSAVAGVVAGLILAFAFLIYILSDGGGSYRWFAARFQQPRREVVERIGTRAWETLSGYVRGVVIVAAFDAVLIGGGLFILDVPLAAALTAMVFLLAFIPIIGAWVSGVVAALVALAGNGVETALVVALISLAVQQLEALVIGPQVYRHTIRLHPMVTLAAVTAGGIMAGVVGAFIAVPITALIWAVVDEAITIRRENALNASETVARIG